MNHKIECDVKDDYVRGSFFVSVGIINNLCVKTEVGQTQKIFI